MFNYLIGLLVGLSLGLLASVVFLHYAAKDQVYKTPNITLKEYYFKGKN